MEILQIDQYRHSSTITIFFCILLPCPNPMPTLPTVQLDHGQFSQRFGYVMLVPANVACRLNIQTQQALTQETSLEDIYQT